MKTDLELNVMADQIFNELAKHTDPQEALTIMGMTFLMIYERCDWQPRPPIEKFVEDMKQGLLTVWKMRTAPAPTTETLQ